MIKVLPSKECRVSLGDEVRDTVTGFKGIVVCRIEWFNGCWRIGVQSKKMKTDGVPSDIVYFDDTQMEITTKFKKSPLAKKVKEVGNKSTGGPRCEEVRGMR
jgi:hypothetical protein